MRSWKAGRMLARLCFIKFFDAYTPQIESNPVTRLVRHDRSQKDFFGARQSILNCPDSHWIRIQEMTPFVRLPKAHGNKD